MNIQVVLTGHSLGAGTAELIYLELTRGASRSILPPGIRSTWSKHWEKAKVFFLQVLDLPGVNTGS